ncbi:hypothetical protein Snov_2835 [Ancylobacter novellus DSM 506]|uniref:Uncharacterized protein n=1 Tax=Ancylobacter novellus (strain ATCC 8093 / DSM 506 / JCM 20403 / CCM 1077 / IAM 12100 / NBRC 12443 / NCIMB 10456) TaxID=639283 RepID=D7A607_ANCN5|nr:hypothetical protein [Ancylobacter novellus]ADH90122.1 hypothetical protein Snov_2835 [Ancylobacter novellus DSM 506]
MPAAPAHADPHRHPHPHDHAHDHAHVHAHHHSHAEGERHPAARPGFSLLRLSAAQRLAIAVPLAALLWAAALAVIWGGA